jgi:hypothetical protein
MGHRRNRSMAPGAASSETVPNARMSFTILQVIRKPPFDQVAGWMTIN